MKGILLSAQEVQALQAGRLTQLRRVVPTPPDEEYVEAEIVGPWCHFQNTRESAKEHDERGPVLKMWTVKCPYGQAGESRFVRETWCLFGAGASHVGYKATDDVCEDAMHGGWRSPVTMAQWASRFTLCIESVGVGRFQEMTVQDAVACGANRMACYGPGCPDGPNGCNARGCFGIREEFQRDWDKQYGAGAYEANPWVWVLEIRRVEK